LPMKKSTQEEFYLKNPHLLGENIRYRFRNKKQFGPGVLFNHLEFRNGNVSVRSGEEVMLIIPRQGGLKDNRPKFETLLKTTKIKFLCFQDLVFLLRENPDEFREVTDFLYRRIISSGQ